MSKKLLSEISDEYKKEKIVSENRLMTLVNQYNSNIITENDRKKITKEIIEESINVERLTLLEAASNLDEEQLRRQYFGMVRTLINLADNLGCYNLKEKVNDMQVNADDMLMLGAADKKSMKNFMSMLTDMSVITKGMLQIAIKVTDEGSDPIGDTINTIKSISNEKVPLATVLNQLGTKQVKKGFFGKRKEEQQVALFIDNLKKAATMSSPGFLRLLGQEVFDDLMQCIISADIKTLQLIFNNYVTKTMDVVDNKFLLSMTKPGLWGTIKNIGDLISGGGTAPRI